MLRLKVGRNANTAELIDGDGNNVLASMNVASMDLRLRPCQPTELVMTVYVDEVEAEVGEDQLTTKRVSRDKTG